MKYSPFPFSDLLIWYEKNGRHDLPWRQYFHMSTKTLTYRIWLSEILLQQTQVSRMMVFFEKILEKYPTVGSLAGATFEDFFPYYQGLGYYSRARNLLKTAKIIAENYQGIFPEDNKLLLELPGVGPYTAVAIRAFAYEKPTLALDTNIQRIFARYYHGDKKILLEKTLREKLENQLKKENISGRIINAALMDFAAVTQKYSDIRESDYPLSGCRWYLTKGELEGKFTQKIEKFPTSEATIIVVLHENHKKYFSEHSSIYVPFLLPSAGKENARHFIQAYFLDRFHVSISVRPIHDKFLKNEVPYIVCNAQIQTGKNQFSKYTKNDLGKFWKKFLTGR